MLCSRVVACRLRVGIRPYLVSGRRNMTTTTPADSSSECLMEDVGDKGLITLNRPKHLNALNHNMIKLIYPKLKQWEATKTMVVIKGSGEKAFCAGGDVKSIVETKDDPQPIGESFFKDEYILNCLIGTLHIPFIALIDGITMGGGVGLSVHGQYRVATEKTVFAMPETAIGLFPDVGGGYFLPRLGGSLGMFLALTGYRLKGRDVMKAGVATHVCDSARVKELEEALFALQSSYPENVAEIMARFHKEATFSKDEPFSLQPFLPQIQSCFSGASVEEIIANLEKDGSEWAKKQLSTISRMSPTSLKVTHEQLTRGASLTLPEVLTMEHRIVSRIYRHHDFSEGIRAVLIDRDNKPIWQPKSLSEVTQQDVQEYFAPLTHKPELEL